MTCEKEDLRNCFVLEGKMALPNQYFAGRLGSKFIIALRDKKKIMGVSCPKCSKTFIPPREYCEHCWTKIAENWVDLSNEGELVNYTVVRYNDKHLPKKAPYILGQIKIRGADTPLTHIVEGVDFKDVHIGMKVKAVFAEKTTNTLMDLDHFEPV
jgi:uncharacterized OB-fold protein